MGCKHGSMMAGVVVVHVWLVQSIDYGASLVRWSVCGNAVLCMEQAAAHLSRAELQAHVLGSLLQGRLQLGIGGVADGRPWEEVSQQATEAAGVLHRGQHTGVSGAGEAAAVTV